MKKLICTALLLPCMAFAGPAKIKNTTTKEVKINRYYARLDAGLTAISSLDLKKSGDNKKTPMRKNVMSSLGFGYRFDHNFSTDLNLQYRELRAKHFQTSADPNVETAHIDTLAVMLNLNAELPTSTNLSPYAMVGIGYKSLKPELIRDARKTSGLAWNLGLGLKYKMSSNTHLDFCYKYIDLGTLKLINLDNNKPYTTKVKGQEFTLGIIFGF